MEKLAHGILFEETELFGRGSEGRRGVDIPSGDLPEVNLDALFGQSRLRRPINGFPQLSEPEVVRHFTRISQWNYGVDQNLYPLGSCTMKYNPKINETLARLDGFTGLHPLQPDRDTQGALEILFELQEMLSKVVGLPHCTVQPAAGAHGEFAGMLTIRAALKKRGETRAKVLLPDSSHGTNPASAALCGYQSVPLASTPDGHIDLTLLREKMDDQTAAIMITNPNTLGVFEANIIDVAAIVHERGGFVYCDGANLNALMGKARFGDMGVDLCHINVHKTFSTPHGGGGPGAGPVCVTDELAPFLPTPVVGKRKGSYFLDYDRPDSVGRLHGFNGNFGILVRAWAYIRSLGAAGLTRASETAAINANYIKARLKNHYNIPIEGHCLHECVINDEWQQENHISTLDIAKGLIDRGFHPPTIYFPLIVKGAMMIEPTETESLETLDAFCDAMIDIAQTAKTNPDALRAAPTRATRQRLDEALAARKPELTCSLCS